VYPTLIPPKDGDLPVNPVLGKEGTSGDSRSRRRLREDTDASVAAEGGAEGISTASVALKAERYRPRIYGFQVNEIAKLQRWQEAVRDRCVPHSRDVGLATHLRYSAFSSGRSHDWKPWRRRRHKDSYSLFPTNTLFIFKYHILSPYILNHKNLSGHFHRLLENIHSIGAYIEGIMLCNYRLNISTNPIQES